jgi:hypothetical protein
MFTENINHRGFHGFPTHGEESLSNQHRFIDLGAGFVFNIQIWNYAYTPQNWLSILMPSW